MILFVEFGSVRSKGVDLDKVIEAIPGVLEAELKKLGVNVEDIASFGEGEDISDCVNVYATGVGCGDVTGLVDVELSLQNNVVCVDSVKLNIEQAIEALTDNDEFEVTAR